MSYDPDSVGHSLESLKHPQVAGKRRVDQGGSLGPQVKPASAGGPALNIPPT